MAGEASAAKFATAHAHFSTTAPALLPPTPPRWAMSSADAGRVSSDARFARHHAASTS